MTTQNPPPSPTTLKHFTLASGDILDLTPYFGKVVSIKSFVLTEPKVVTKKMKNEKERKPSVISMCIADGEFVVCTLVPNKIPQVNSNMILTDTENLSIRVNGGSGEVNVILEVRD